MKKVWILGVLVLILVVSGCSSAPDTPAAAPAEQQPPAASKPSAVSEPQQATEISPAGSLTGIDGKTLLEERCVVCHDLSRVERKKASVDGWTSTVDRMIEHGAKLTDAEKQVLIEFLSTTYGN